MVWFVIIENASILKSMNPFTDIFIVYNPVSTGPSKKNAEEFASRLKRALPASTSIATLATRYPGHGREIARKLASSTPRCLIISSSGDGGYHDIINGALESGSSTVVTGLLPSGNANDHYHALHMGNTIQRIIRGSTQIIDLLLVEGQGPKGAVHEYAHSYVGLGLTPQIGKELTRAKLNRLTEILLTLRYLFSSRPVRIKVAGKTIRYRSLIFSNIHRMSKVLTLSDKAAVDDGLFEVNALKDTSFVGVLLHLIRASTLGLEGNSQTDLFEFSCPRSLLIQLDGEVIRLAAGSVCTVATSSTRLACIV